MTSIASVFVDARLDTSRFGPDIKSGMSHSSVASANAAAGKKAGAGYTSAFGNALKIGGALAAGFAVVKGVDFLKGAVSEASNLNEVTSKLNVVFGDSSKSIQRFAATAAGSLGQSKLAVQEAAASFGVFGKVAGLNERENSKFSVSLAKLSSDMASFSNTTPEQAVEALGSALRGESEPIRQYGVLLDEAALKAEAAAQGIIKPIKNLADIKLKQAEAITSQKAYNDAVAEFGKDSFEATKASAALQLNQDQLSKATDGTIEPLTQQQKVLAAQSLIMKQTKDAQGDFARTSGGLANQQRILAAQFDNVKASVGEVLLPVITKLFTYMTETGIPAVQGFGGYLKSDVVPAFRDLAGFVKENADLITPLAGVLGAAALAFGAVSLATTIGTAAMALYATGLVTTAAAEGVAATSTWSLNAALLANPVAIVIVGLTALSAAVVVAYKRSDTFREIVDKAFAVLKSAAGGAWRAVKPILGNLVDGFKAVVGFVRNHWPEISAVVKRVFDFVKDYVRSGFDVVRGIFRTATAVLRGDWSGAWDGMKDVLRGAWSAIKSVVSLGWDAVKAILGGVGGYLKDKLVGAFQSVVGGIKTAWNKVKEIAAAPIRFMVNTVLNDGLIGGFNKLAKFFGSDGISPIELPEGFARGGVYPGYTPGRDTGYAAVSGGEAIMRPEWTRAVGKDTVDAMNKAARQRGVEGVRRYMGGFAAGGTVIVDGEPLSTIDAAQIRLAEHLSNTNMNVMQGSFQAPSSYSGTSHTGSGVADTSPGNFTAQYWLRRVGLAAWGRNFPGAASAGSGAHIHSVSQFDPAAAGNSQLAAFYAGGDGLGGSDYGPRPALLPNLAALLGAVARDLDIFGRTTGATGGVRLPDWVSNVVGNPKEWLLGKIGSLDGIGGGQFGEVLKSIPGKVVAVMVDKVKAMLPAVGYDTGGTLRPGLTMAFNGTGADETVRTKKQQEQATKEAEAAKAEAAAAKTAAKELAAAIKSLTRDIKQFDVRPGGSASETRSAVNALLAGLREVVGRESPLLKRVDVLGDRLVTAAKAQDAAVAKYDKATSRLDSLRDASRQLAQSVAAAYTNEAFGGDLTLAGSRLQLRADTNDALETTRDLARARRRGFGGAAYRQVAESGNKQLIDQLAHSSRREIARYERLVSARASATGGLGRETADALLGRGIEQQTRVVKRLDRTIDRLNDRIDRLEPAVERGARRGVGDRDRTTRTRRKGR